MALRNDWVGYLDRSYQQIKQSVLNRVTLSNPELTDHNESNPFIIIIDIFAGIAEMLGYYIDNTARESFLSTALRRTSVIKHATSYDYRIKARNPESVDVTFFIVDGIGDPLVLAADVTVPAGTVINSNSDSIQYITLQNVILTAGQTSYLVPFSQVVELQTINLGQTNGIPFQEVLINTSYVHNSISILVDGVPYTRVNSFATSRPTDTHYIVNINTNNEAIIVFGDGKKGILPSNGLDIISDYQTTLGPDGKINRNELTTAPIITLGPGENLNVDNLIGSSGGTFFEDTEDIRDNTIKSIRTNDRMVTREDYIDIIQTLPGVSKAEIDYDCGKTIEIYIAPDGGGTASSTLISEAQTEADLKKMVTTFPTILAAGETDLVVKLNVKPRSSDEASIVINDVNTAILEYGSSDNHKINSEIRVSDLIALVDNLPRVDYLNLKLLTTIPFARIRNGANDLDWSRETLDKSTTIKKWSLEFNGGNIRIFRNNVFQGNVALDTNYIDTDGCLEFTVNSGPGYVNGDRWDFITYPINEDILLQDFTLIKTSLSNIEVNIVS